MQLTPKLPPGRASRKALAFCAEIHRLREDGYSFEAIRQALQDVGVVVCCATVRREAARTPGGGRSAQGDRRTKPAAAQMASTSDTVLQKGPALSPAAATFFSKSRSGREIAEAFMRDRISNPLVRERMEDEARRD